MSIRFQSQNLPELAHGAIQVCTECKKLQGNEHKEFLPHTVLYAINTFSATEGRTGGTMMNVLETSFFYKRSTH
jgi:hypothetical protein